MTLVMWVIDTSDCNLEIRDWVRLRKLFHLFNGVGNALLLQAFVASILFGIFAYYDDNWKPILWIVLLAVPSFFMYKLSRAFFSRYGRTSIIKLERNFLILQILLSSYWGLSFALLIMHLEFLNTTLLFIEVFFISISLGFYLYSFVCYAVTTLLITLPTIFLFFFDSGIFSQLGYLFIVYLIFYLFYAWHIIKNIANSVKLHTLNENLNKQLLVANKQLVEESSTDYLTGISNRRTMITLFGREWSRALRQQYPISVMMIDVDSFKKYNDHYGHLMGDDALRIIADTFTKVVCRPGDIVSRYGGEEFLTVLSGTDAKNALILADRIRKAVYDLNVPHLLSEFKRVTVSIGIYSSQPLRDEKYLEYIQLSDVALYHAKEHGRNKVAFYDSAMEHKVDEIGSPDSSK